MHTSRYTLYVGLPETRDKVLLVHGYSGAFDLVSRDVANWLRSLETAPIAEPLHREWMEPTGDHSPPRAPSDATVELLRRRGYLTRKTPDQEVDLIEKIVESARQAPGRPSYMLMLTYHCNLRCTYCYQSHMRGAADPRMRQFMDRAMVDRIYQALPALEARHDAPPRDQFERFFMLYGGEPLLRRNRDTVEYILQRAREDGPARVHAVTNGTQLRHYADLLGPEGIRWVQISIDGPKRLHDRTRPYASGRGSFDDIVDNITLALDRGTEVSVRINTDRNNLSILPELEDLARQRGWDSYPGFQIYSEHIEQANDQTLRSDMLDSWDIARWSDARAIQSEQPVLVSNLARMWVSNFMPVFAGDKDPRRMMKVSHCAAHGSAYIFDPAGDLYACWERTGDPLLRVGTLGDAGEVRFDEEPDKGRMPGSPESPGTHQRSDSPRTIEGWRDRTILTTHGCRECRYALYCGGGCAARAENAHGSYYAPFCNGAPQRIQWSLATAYQECQRRGAEAPASTTNS